jgi:hypothetical protein
MTLQLHTGPNTDAVIPALQTVEAKAQTVPTATYRCSGCGDVLHFNALSATCRCIDECYAEPSAKPDVTLRR